MTRVSISFVLLGIGISSIAFGNPPVPPVPANAPVPLEDVAPGSLWSETESRTLVGMDSNSRQIGDLITVNISEQTETELQADTSGSRDSSVGGGVGSVLGIGSGIVGANSDLNGNLSIEVSGNSDYSGDGRTSREGTLNGTLTCRVIEVMPNGNLKLWGYKEVRSNRETQYLILQGLVRPQDVQADNTVDSYLLAEAHIEFAGSGTVGDRQRPGIGHRILDNAWPF